LPYLAGDITLSFDKSNVSEEVMETLVIEGVHFVTAVGQNRMPKLFSLPNQDFKAIAGIPASKALAFDLERCHYALSGEGGGSCRKPEVRYCSLQAFGLAQAVPAA